VQFLSVKFMEQMSTLVSFHGEQTRMEEQIPWIAFRHIKYGARPQHSKVMGDVLIETLKRAVGEEWTSDMETAWFELWTKSCDMMVRVIGMSSQLSFSHYVQVQAWSSAP
jgi:hemoglobin-like flavoprotein